MGRNKVSISVAADTAAARQQINNFGKELNQSKRSVRDLTAAYSRLDDATKKSSIGRQMQQDLQSAINRYKELEQIQNKINNNLGKTPNNNLSGISASMNTLTETADAFGSKFGVSTAALAKMASPAGIAVAAAGAVGASLYKAEKHAIEFEDALSNLSAITGTTGKDLDALKDRIIATGKETHTSFKTIADAYTVVGSKMPTLLQNQEGLDAVTRSVITLKKASRMSLEDATNSLTGIMNQMGASFFEADEYINVLAAGSKNGAGNIQYLATAFDQCGTAISTANLSIQEGTALIEMLAEKQPSASTAGVQLRNVLIKLTTASDEYNPKVVGLTTALQNLANKTGDTSWMVKMFGAENMAAAIQLAKNAVKVRNLTKAVTGTTEAHKQAAIQVNNVAGAWRGLGQDWDNFATAITSKSGPIQTVLRAVIGGLSEIVKFMNYLAGGKSELEISFDNNTQTIKNRARKAVEKTSKPGETSRQKQLRYANGPLTDEINSKINFLRNEIKNGQSEEYIGLIRKQIKNLATERYLGRRGKLKIFNTTPQKPPQPPQPDFDSNTPTYRPSKTTHTPNTPKRDAIEEAKKSYAETMTELNGLLKDSMILEQDYNEKKKSALESLREAYYKQGKTAENSTELANLNKEYGKVKEALHNSAIDEADRELGASIKEADDLYRNNIITRKENNDAIIEAERKYVEKMLQLGNLTDKQKSNLKAVKDELDANLKDRRNEEYKSSWDSIDQKSQSIELKYNFVQDKKSNRDVFNDLVREYDEKKKKLDEAIKDEEHPISLKLKIESQEELDKLEQKIDKTAKKVKREANFDSVFNTFSDLGNIASSINSIGNAFENVKNPLQGFAVSMQAITTLMQTYKTIVGLVTAAQNLFAKSTTASAEADNASTEAQIANSNARVASKTAEAEADTAATTTQVANSETKVSAIEAETAADTKSATAATTNATTKAAAATAAATADTAATGVEVANSEAKTAAAGHEALAKAAKSGAGIGFPANIAAIAAGVAAVIAALSAFATGGIVGGSGASTTMGDNTLIRVNRGEMVLNNRQQARLFKMLDGGLSLNTTSTGGTVDFRISGSNLYGSLKNYSSMVKKHGKITGIS